jgi:cytochrome P450
MYPETSSDGESTITEIALKKGTTLYISVLGANRNKSVWGEDADEWTPERWLRPLPQSVQDSRLPGIYSQMMTFLGGARSCIGFKFAEMELSALQLPMPGRSVLIH